MRLGSAGPPSLRRARRPLAGRSQRPAHPPHSVESASSVAGGSLVRVTAVNRLREPPPRGWVERHHPAMIGERAPMRREPAKVNTKPAPLPTRRERRADEGKPGGPGFPTLLSPLGGMTTRPGRPELARRAAGAVRDGLGRVVVRDLQPPAFEGIEPGSSAFDAGELLCGADWCETTARRRSRASAGFLRQKAPSGLATHSAGRAGRVSHPDR